MQVSDFDFHLPPDSIAQEPPAERGTSRLLRLDRASGAIHHSSVAELPALLRKGDLLVVNDTRVFPARLLGRRDPSGGSVECLLVCRAPAPSEDQEVELWEALVHPGQKLKPGARVDRLDWLDEYDAYYYDREGGLTLPVLRVRYADAKATWYYVDPVRGAAVRREERLTRLNRWLYHGLHSFDFPFLYDRRPLWDVVVIVFSLGGLVLSTTTMAPAWRRLLRHLRRLL